MSFYQQKEFEERLIQIRRVSKKNTGGNRIGFTALMIVGDKKGNVGVGLGKAPDVASAIRKGIKVAKRNIVKIPLGAGTIPHRIAHKYKSSKIVMMPAPEGSGVIAGGAIRDVMELAGIRNISAKLVGTSNKLCNVRCAVEALTELKWPKVEKLEASA